MPIKSFDLRTVCGLGARTEIRAPCFHSRVISTLYSTRHVSLEARHAEDNQEQGIVYSGRTMQPLPLPLSGF